MVERSSVRERAMPDKLIKSADIMEQSSDFSQAQVIIYSPCGEYMCCMSMNIDL